MVRPDSSIVKAEYFGLHIHRAVSMAANEPESVWPAGEHWSWRMWDAGVAWTDLQPRRDAWYFARLDALCERARAKHVKLLLTLGLTPGWASARPLEPSNYGLGNQAPPADLEDWRRYVDTIAKRYRGQIEAYEIWNEPNLPGFYSGTPEQLVDLARVAYLTVKAVDPSAVIVTPSATGIPGGLRWLTQYLAAGGDRYDDVVGFHFYVTPRDPENMLAAIDTVRAVLAHTKSRSLPLWNTETGWLLQNHDLAVLPRGAPGSFGSRVLDDTTGAAFVARALIIGRCGSLARFYWYAWDNRRMGLTEADGKHVKAEASAFLAVQNWLVGANVVSCARTKNGVWIVRLTQGGDRHAAIVWSTTGAHVVTLSDARAIESEQSLLGNRLPLPTVRRSTIRASAQPTLYGYSNTPPRRER